MLEESLVSLAVLKVNWDQRGRDYVDNFIPFVGEGLRRCPQDHVSIAQLQAVIKDGFGLIIPQGALNTLLTRAQRYGYVRKAQGVFERILDAIPATFSSERENVTRQQRALIEKLVCFCKERHNVVWSVDQADNALVAHLQRSSVPILAAAVEGSPIPMPAGDVPHSEFLVSSFVVDLSESDPDGFGFLETVMKGHMLATALFLPDISKASQKFDDLEVFINTRLLLRALGFEGEGLKAPCVELLTLLYRTNVTLSCFDITLDELRGVLDAAQHALRDPRYQHRPQTFSVYEHFVSIGKRASDVELAIAKLEESLRKLHVRVKPKPDHTIALGLNERKLEETVSEELPHLRLEAKRHDVDCLTSIHRLRKGMRYSDIERSKYIFLSTNHPLARASARFFREEYEATAAPLCINDHALTTLAWVKNPTYVADFSRSRLIADSYVALSPSGELWRKYLDEAARLKDAGDISDADYQLLKFSTVARNALLNATLNSPDAFTEGTVPEILEKARANARQQVEKELRAEVDKRQSAEQEVKNFRVWHHERAEKLMAFAARTGAWCSRVLYLAMAAIFCVGFYATLPPSFPELVNPARLSIQAGIVIFAIFTAWNAFEGGNVRAIARRVEVSVAQRFGKWLVEKFLK